MDLVLEAADHFVFDKAYAQLLPKGGVVDQFIQNNPLLLNVKSNFVNYKDSFNGTLTSAAPTLLANPIISSIYNSVVNYQNQDEIYGLKPTTFFDVTSYTEQSILSRSNILREGVSIFIVTAIFGWLLYFSVASLSYYFVFDKKIFNHPRYLKNQIWLEIERATTAIPVMVLLTTPVFLMELRGFSYLYYDINESTGGWSALWWQIPKFILFTDCGIYFIHRWLHWPSVYKALHKPHHKWIVCTPFASHAFHPVDGFFQSIPYHIYPMVFPLHKVLYLFLFTFVNFWTVMIHDGQYLSNDPFVNGTACHTVHHLYFNYNYGQFTTLWDRIGGSYRRPDDSLFVKDSKKDQDEKVWKQQVVQMEEIRNELEGKTDDREYISKD
ncbi:C-5 sterol desaturase [Scheffersomyces coipomensis]|uniref:C-5 sterol desaturase n=1 Tax=Scheffersomyces coipomensis TaxID=1788519 RepID=UPI00315D8FE3